MIYFLSVGVSLHPGYDDVAPRAPPVPLPTLLHAAGPDTHLYDLPQEETAYVTPRPADLTYKRPQPQGLLCVY